MFVYNLYQYYIVYMKHVSMLGRLNLSIPHIHYEQAKSFSYSLCFTYEQPNIQLFINKSTTYVNIFGYLNVCLYELNVGQTVRYLESFQMNNHVKTYARMFGEAKEGSYIYGIIKN